MRKKIPDLLVFEEIYFERIWGGKELKKIFGKSIPDSTPTGEAWLISDHPHGESIVKNGPLSGESLHTLICNDPVAILGEHAKPTHHGRFPLLLKLLDAHDVLSVQVHPDDMTAEKLNEPDCGKTEMWYVLQAKSGASLICGLHQGTGPEQVRQAVQNNTLSDLMIQFQTRKGTTVFVPAGTVHAIGKGNLIAEIQQNSDITYRLYDWGRVQSNGKPRELHIEKALQAIHFGTSFPAPVTPLCIETDNCTRTFCAACRYFCTEQIELDSTHYTRETRKSSFHIILATDSAIKVYTENEEQTLSPGYCLLVTGQTTHYTVAGTGKALIYYVPQLEQDVIAPLKKNGYTDEKIALLGIFT